MTSIQEKLSWKWYDFPSFFSKEEVKELSEFIENNYIKHENPEHGATAGFSSIKHISTVKIIDYIQVEPFISRLVNLAYQIANYDFGYDTFGPHLGQPLLYNTYQSKKKDYYDWHYDESRSATFDCKMTLLINLSTEPYKGGEFQTWTNMENSHSDYDQTGSAIMIKSNVYHRVLPVTKGTRKSLTMFIDGPRFR